MTINSVVDTTLKVSAMVIGVKTMERVAGYKRRKPGSKRKTQKVKGYKRKRVKKKKKKKRKK